MFINKLRCIVLSLLWLKYYFWNWQFLITFCLLLRKLLRCFQSNRYNCPGVQHDDDGSQTCQNSRRKGTYNVLLGLGFVKQRNSWKCPTGKWYGMIEAFESQSNSKADSLRDSPVELVTENRDLLRKPRRFKITWTWRLATRWRELNKWELKFDRVKENTHFDPDVSFIIFGLYREEGENLLTEGLRCPLDKDHTPVPQQRRLSLQTLLVPPNWNRRLYSPVWWFGD